MKTSLRLALALLLTACGGGSDADAGGGGSDAATGTDAGAESDAGAGTDAGEGTDAGVTACDYVNDLDRSCATDGDCAVGLHQTDCCGSSVMIGFNTSEQASYAAKESACMATYPACGCPAMLPTTDSGETVTDTSAVQAACVSRGPTMVCLTYLTMRPADTP